MTNVYGCYGGGTLNSSFDGTDVWGEGSSGGSDGQLGQVYDPSTGAVLNAFKGFAPAFGYGEAVQAVPGSTGTSLGRPGTSTVQAFDPTTLAVRWSFQEPSADPPIGSEPLLADGYVFAEGSQGTVWALAACSGAVAWQGQVAPLPYSIVYEPIPSLAAGDGYLIVPSTNGLTAFKGSGLPTGPSRDCRLAPSTPAAPPASPTTPPTPPARDSTTPIQATAKAPAFKVLNVRCVLAAAKHGDAKARCTLNLLLNGPLRIAARLRRAGRLVAATQARVYDKRARLVLHFRGIMRPGHYQLDLTAYSGQHRVARLTKAIHMSRR